MRRFIVPVTVLLLACAGAYYSYLYPPTVYRRITQAALDSFDASFVGSDKSKVAASLATLLTEDAHITLGIGFFNPAGTGRPPMAEEFTKPDFMNFMDNILYTLTDYSFHSEAQTIVLSRDHKSANVLFSGVGAAEGLSYYGGTAVTSRFSNDLTCDATVRFENKQARFSKVVCKMTLHQIPKSGEESKLMNNPEALKDLLR